MAKQIDYQTVTVVEKASQTIANESADIEAIDQLEQNILAKLNEVRLANGWSDDVERALNLAFADLVAQIIVSAIASANSSK